MKNKPIAVFDSGVGGLTVYEKLKSILPNENYIYFGDLKNSPYGQKSKEQLLDITSYIFDFFKKENVKAVVMELLQMFMMNTKILLITKYIQ